MTMVHVTFVATTLLCTLTAGLVFTFAVVVMPGIRTLADADFVRAFQVMDRVIQDNHPLFLLVWVGSVVGVVASAALALGTLHGSDRLLLVLAAAVYVIGVQLPTFVVNVPLNNRLQEVDVDAVDGNQLRAARRAFEARWNRWNGLRTGFACLSSAAMMVVLIRI